MAPPLPPPGRLDSRYVAARRVLLDALTALGRHGRAFIVVGARAIYLRTGSADLSMTVAPFTTDGDLALDPRHLADQPALETAMTEAGFSLISFGHHVKPGIWLKAPKIDGRLHEVPVDLIVPHAGNTGGGRRMCSPRVPRQPRYPWGGAVSILNALTTSHEGVHLATMSSQAANTSGGRRPDPPFG